MLERFGCIENVGRLQNYGYEAGHDYSRLTIVYGDNSAGKTTLASILDSLRENNPSIILRRTTLPGRVKPRVSLSISGQEYEFANGGWSSVLPHDTLEVFYSDFVSRNVYSGVSVALDHGRNLCEFFLGRKAVEAVIELLQVDKDARTTKSNLNEQETLLKNLAKPPDDLEGFIASMPDADIDKKITAAQKSINEVANLNKILDTKVPERVAPVVVDTQKLQSIFDATLDAMNESSVATVREHIQEKLDEAGEKWLAYGMDHIHQNVCPFCGQDVLDLLLVDALRHYFSEEYTQFSTRLNGQISEQLKILSLEGFMKNCTELDQQILIAASWSDQYQANTEELQRTLGEARQEWESGFGILTKALAEKQQNPAIRIAPQRLDDALARFERATAAIISISDILEQCARAATKHKMSLNSMDSEKLKLELGHLQNVKARNEAYASELIEKRTHLLQERKTLDDRRKVLKTEIDTVAQTVVTKYQDDINYYLRYFGSAARIEEVEAKYPSGRATVSYKLVVAGHNIPLGFSEQEPCFDTVLSEGEKVTLALAFFMARLKDRAIEDMTVVFDDPVNSFGRERRRLTEEAIHDLYDRKAQVVVFTHDERLAAMLWRDRRIMHPDISCLCIEQAGNESKMRYWDIEDATTSQYVKDYLTLDNFIQNGGDHLGPAARIRPYVEARIRFLFPGPPITTRDSLGSMIGKIKASNPGDKLAQLKAKISDLESISDAALPSHHDMERDLGVDELTTATVRVFAEKAISVLE